MNAKEEILQMIKAHQAESDNPEIFNDLIDAVENAIFDVPSEEERTKEVKSRKLNHNQTMHFCRGMNYILNYKKPETDGK